MKLLFTCFIVFITAKGFVFETARAHWNQTNEREQYEVFKDSINQYKKAVYDQTGTIYFAKAGKLLHHLVADSFYTYWAGTPWDFSGKTQCPRKGAIACGYFVTAVLQDAGVPVNRIDLAEIASETMIKKLVQPKSIKHYVPFDLPQFIEDIKQRGDALYVIGLDYHTGFISFKNGQVWIIHSGVDGVVKELAEHASTLIYNRYGVTGCISSDTTLLRKWLYNSN